MYLHHFTFNPFQENTYLVWDEAGHCAIIDPGCYTASEEIRLKQYIESKQLKPVFCLLTHGHIDHVAGCAYVARTWPDAPLVAHPDAVREMRAAEGYAGMYGFSLAPGPEPDRLLAHGDVMQIGSLQLEVLYTPGHSLGSVSFLQREAGVLIAGDVLFAGSIGRTDLPGGDYKTLMHSIFDVLLPLDGDTQVFPGHGPSTTLAAEAKTNPFLLQWQTT